MKKNFLKYRKAYAAGLTVFLASFPAVGLVDGTEQGDWKTLLTQAVVAAFTAGVTAITSNVDEDAV